MRKIVILGLFFSLAAPGTWAKSTCQTRVDKHPESSTVERVEYCLNEEPETQNGPQVITQTVTVTTHQQEPATKKRSFVRKSYFKNKKVSVSRSYVSTNRFPEWKNDIPSEQEILKEQQAKEASLQPAPQPQKKNTPKTTATQPYKVPAVTVQTESNTASVSPRVHGVVVSTTSTTSSSTREETYSGPFTTEQPVQKTVSSSRTVSSKTISTPAMGKTLEEEAASAQQKATAAYDEADELFNEQASAVVTGANRAYDKTQQAAQQANQQAQAVLDDVDNKLQKSYQRAEQTGEQAVQRAQTAVQNASNRAEQTATQRAQQAQERLDGSINQAQQAADKAAADAQQTADKAFDEADELFNDWNY